jgi:hypothetical protein
LIISDLGLSPAPHRQSPFDLSEWLRFAHALAEHGCPLVAFVPYPPARWSRHLRQKFAIIQWDRPTSVRTVRQVIGRILEVR